MQVRRCHGFYFVLRRPYRQDWRMRPPNRSPRRAMQILEEVAASHNIPIARVVGPCRSPKTSAVRKEFSIRAIQQNISALTVSDILSCDRSVVYYYNSPTAKARKRNQKRESRQVSGVMAWCKLLRAVEMAER